MVLNQEKYLLSYKKKMTNRMNNTNDKMDEKYILEKLKEAEDEMNNTTKRYSLDEVSKSMTDIINKR